MKKPKPATGLPREPIDLLIDPLKRFLHVEAASGVVLLAATAAALLLANSPLRDAYEAFWETKLGWRLGDGGLILSLQHWINDGLMTVFFFVIGLEVKREMVMGELKDLRRATLPVAAAIGGMIVPAAVYLALQAGAEGARGWGIPMATDIAFVVGCLAVLGPRIPSGLRVLLLSLAIVDDIGAILVIAVGYTDHLDLGALALGILGIGLLLAMMRAGVRNPGLYLIVMFLIWVEFHASGIHATIAGVIFGLLTPATAWVSRSRLGRIVQRTSGFLHGEGWKKTDERYVALRDMERATREAISPLEIFETELHPWVAFLIMPVFALANAGVPVRLEAFADPAALAVMAGLLLGKPAGVLLFSWLAVKLGIARLPTGVDWKVLAGGGFLAGIGFTMALFIAGLALDGKVLESAKVGILAASALCATIGLALLYRFLPPAAAPQQKE